MQPIQDLLNRIRWDEEFGQGEFLIAYYDRVKDGKLTVPFAALQFFPGDHFTVGFVDDEGVTHTIPLHRIRAVYKDGKLIWQRP
ncbi:MAG: DUF504 domain-containing protein [Pseudomonadota bacterium]